MLYDDDDELGSFDAVCVACEAMTRVYDLGLCADCGEKFDRDLIRQRDWEYSATAFAVPPGKREELRMHVIREHGPDLELIAPTTASPSMPKAPHGRRRPRVGIARKGLQRPAFRRR